MDVKQLRFFRKVYESQNMQHSADELFITRQGLRHVIKALECEIGEPLFEVRKNRLEPTEAAHKLYQLSDGAIAAFEKVEASICPRCAGGSSHRALRYCPLVDGVAGQSGAIVHDWQHPCP